MTRRLASIWFLAAAILHENARTGEVMQACISVLDRTIPFFQKFKQSNSLVSYDEKLSLNRDNRIWWFEDYPVEKCTNPWCPEGFVMMGRWKRNVTSFSFNAMLGGSNHDYSCIVFYHERPGYTVYPGYYVAHVPGELWRQVGIGERVRKFMISKTWGCWPRHSWCSWQELYDYRTASRWTKYYQVDDDVKNNDCPATDWSKMVARRSIPLAVDRLTNCENFTMYSPKLLTSAPTPTIDAYSVVGDPAGDPYRAWTIKKHGCTVGRAYAREYGKGALFVFQLHGSIGRVLTDHINREGRKTGDVRCPQRGSPVLFEEFNKDFYVDY